MWITPTHLDDTIAYLPVYSPQLQRDMRICNGYWDNGGSPLIWAYKVDDIIVSEDGIAVIKVSEENWYTPEQVQIKKNTYNTYVYFDKQTIRDILGIENEYILPKNLTTLASQIINKEEWEALLGDT